MIIEETKIEKILKNEIEEKLLCALIFDEITTNFEKKTIIENCHSDFFYGDNKKIFIAIEKLVKEKKEINVFNLIDIFKAKKEINLIETLDIIQSYDPISKSIPFYIETLFKPFFEKRIKLANTENDLKKLHEIEMKFNPRKNLIQHISKGALNWEKDLNKKAKAAIYTLYPKIDDIIGSFQGGDYIALGGATGQGKTAFALNLAKNVSMCNKKVLYCSLEMPLEQLQNRFNCLTSNIDSKKVRNFDFDLIEKEKYISGLSQLSQWDINVTTDYKLTPSNLEEIISILKPNFVIIDYLSLLQSDSSGSLYEKTTVLSREIKILATQYNVPILVLVQLNRELRNRENKRPILSDIRESGSIEQDADFVFFVHREYVYDINANEKKMEIIIAKNRHGTSAKTAYLKFNADTQLIEEWSIKNAAN